MERRSFRNCVTWTIFLYTVLVIFVHSYNAELFLGTAGIATPVGRFETFVSSSLGQVAVPGFFMISAVLFFRNYDLGMTAEKLTRRVRTLLIPYLLWNALYYLGYVIASRIPGLTDLVGKGTVPVNLREILRAIFLYDYNFVFWFLFQLMILTLLSPLLWLLLENALTFAAAEAVLCAVIALRFDPTPLNSDALFYYFTAAGVSVRIRQNAEQEMLRAGVFYRRGIRRKNSESRTRALLLLLLSLFSFLLWRHTQNDLPLVLGRLCGAAAVWFAFRAADFYTHPGIMESTFLIYALHYAIVRLFSKGLDVLFHGSAAAALLTYLFMPALVLLITVLVRETGVRFAPHLLGLFTGEREA